MSTVVLGISHRTAPFDLLERCVIGPVGALALVNDVLAAEGVSEALVVATCNRVEVYAEAATFHGSVTALGEALSQVTRIPLDDLQEHLYVHWEDRAIAHLFELACGLDSVAVGEAQILGQLRDALYSAQQAEHVGPVLDGLFQHALRVGKRAHAETGLDAVSRSLVERGLAHAVEHVGPMPGARVLVVGAGSMSSLAAATAARAGARSLTVVNRTREAADRLAVSTGGVALGWADLPAALTSADIVLSCTGALGHVVEAPVAAAAAAAHGGPQVYIDLALPRDVAPEVADLPQVRLLALADLADVGEDPSLLHEEVAVVRSLATTEVAAYLAARRVQSVAPTVAALRSRANAVMETELARLEQRLPELDDADRAQVRLAMHRVVDKLLHAPTVRVKELVGAELPGDYTQALRDLFDLDPHEVANVDAPPRKGPNR